MQKWLSYILVVLIFAMLPAVTLAANHHDSQHHASEHCHTSAPEVTAQHGQNADSSADDQHGEHHCCHSHSVVAALRAHHGGNLQFAQFKPVLLTYSFSTIAIFLPPDFRPPIV